MPGEEADADAAQRLVSRARGRRRAWRTSSPYALPAATIPSQRAARPRPRDRGRGADVGAHGVERGPYRSASASSCRPAATNIGSSWAAPWRAVATRRLGSVSGRRRHRRVAVGDVGVHLQADPRPVRRDSSMPWRPRSSTSCTVAGDSTGIARSASVHSLADGTVDDLHSGRRRPRPAPRRCGCAPDRLRVAQRVARAVEAGRLAVPEPDTPSTVRGSPRDVDLATPDQRRGEFLVDAGTRLSTAVGAQLGGPGQGLVEAGERAALVSGDEGRRCAALPASAACCSTSRRAMACTPVSRTGPVPARYRAASSKSTLKGPPSSGS